MKRFLKTRSVQSDRDNVRIVYNKSDAIISFHCCFLIISLRVLDTDRYFETRPIKNVSCLLRVERNLIESIV